MSKTARKAPTGYRPSGRQCAECHYAKHDCSGLEFDQMPPAGKRDADGVQRVACSGYARGHVVDADKMVEPAVALDACAPAGAEPGFFLATDFYLRLC